jgi:hypothetical protein
METGKKETAVDAGTMEGLAEATAGWDPYVSDLIQEKQSAPRAERRRRPRDKTPARRRSILASGEEGPETTR